MLQMRYPSQIVDEVLAAFVLKPHRADGNYYPGNTLKNILSALFSGYEKEYWGVEYSELCRKVIRGEVLSKAPQCSGLAAPHALS